MKYDIEKNKKFLAAMQPKTFESCSILGSLALGGLLLDLEANFGFHSTYLLAICGFLFFSQIFSCLYWAIHVVIHVIILKKQKKEVLPHENI